MKLEVSPTEILPGANAGDQVGRYKLLEKIGEGGFGEVWMAEQEEPVRRRVALKIVKLGMDTKEVVARFEAERQALALMEHTNIARVFDGGATASGRPYFVMELVRGVPITTYCDQHRLSVDERLELFMHVCQAVQHAHQKGIIHRDLKPSNVLVALVDDRAVPKVIDFGIAKATAQRLTEKTFFTRFQQFVGTPAYMSPEQAGANRDDIDTRSDVYSLGVLLYELLTGQVPLDSQVLLQAGFEAMLKAIRENEPPKPSTRITTLGKDVLSVVASGRRTAPEKLSKNVRGDLDWIVMKCLEKDRTRRYPTANALGMDVQRHLNSEPVVACPPSVAYRFRKLVCRNKLAFAAGAGIGASLLLGLALSTVMFFRERAAKEHANQQTAIAKAVNDFLQKDLLRQADSRAQADSSFQPNPNLTVREALDRAAGRIGERFKDQPLVEAAIRLSIGEAYWALQDGARALPHLQRALDLRRAALGADHPDTLIAMNDLGMAYLDAGKTERGLPMLEEALNLMKPRLGMTDTNTLIAMNNLALAYRDAGKFREALRLFEQTVEAMKVTLGPEHQDTLTAMNSLAWTYRIAGRLEQALRLFEDTVPRMKATMANHPNTLVAMSSLATAYADAGKFDKALPLFEETMTLMTARLEKDHADRLRTMDQLGLAYREAGKLELALPLLEEAVELSEAKLGYDHQTTFNLKNSLALAYLAAGSLEQALALFEEGLNLTRAKLPPNHPSTLASMNNLARAYQAAGRFDQALPLYEEVVRIARIVLTTNHPNTLIGMNNLAMTYRDAGKLEQARRLFQETLDLRKARLGPTNPDTLNTMAGLGLTLVLQSNYADAEPMLRQCLDLREKALGNEHTDVADSLEGIAALLQAQGKTTEAEVRLREALRIRKTKLPADRPDVAVVLARLTSTLLAQDRFADAESFARDSVDILEKKLPKHWRTAWSRSLLGACLLGKKEYAPAEPLLLSAFDSLNHMKDTLPPEGRTSFVATGQQLVTLYEAWGKTEQAAEWKVRLLEIKQHFP
jgi:tetratricopeptide (TPR) repeat protein